MEYVGKLLSTGNVSEAEKDAFLKMYNKACDILNTKYEEWNEEFDTTGMTDSEYIPFIIEKSKPILKKINAAAIKGVKLCLDQEACVVGKSKSGDIMFFRLFQK